MVTRSSTAIMGLSGGIGSGFVGCENGLFPTPDVDCIKCTNKTVNTSYGFVDG